MSSFESAMELHPDLEEMVEKELNQRVNEVMKEQKEKEEFKARYGGQIEDKTAHGCNLPPMAGFSPGQVFRCNCGKRWVLSKYRRYEGQEWMRTYPSPVRILPLVGLTFLFVIILFHPLIDNPNADTFLEHVVHGLGWIIGIPSIIATIGTNISWFARRYRWDF